MSGPDDVAACPPVVDVPLRAELYPQHLLPVAGAAPGPADQFDLLRERLLLDYGKNTARAYWGDLEQWRDWCEVQAGNLSPVGAIGSHLVRYAAQLKADGYSIRTIARRRSVLLRLAALAAHGAAP